MACSDSNIASLYVQEKGRLARLIERIVRNGALAEDLVQDTFVRVLVSPKAAGIENGAAYLSRVARNLAIDQTRRQKQMLSLEEAGIFAMADPSPSAEAALAGKQALALTLVAMEQLPERTRRALQMHRLGEATLADIGRQLGISTSLAGRLVLEGYQQVRDRVLRIDP